jgi:hypothetical protein
MRRTPFAWSLLVIAPMCFAACGDDAESEGGGGEGGSSGKGGTKTSSNAGGAGGGGEFLCDMPQEVPCEDALILGMNLQDDITDGQISNVPDGAGFRSTIDATAGGAFTADPESYTYAKFTDAGLVKVEINDEMSLTSMDWDIAFRRYIVRINSGNSGPSCVAAARVPGAATYDDILEVPQDLTFRHDEYFTPEPSCGFIADGSGLEDSPATALSSYWSYPGCVQMTYNSYIVGLNDRRKLKLTVTHFYGEAAQAECQETGNMPSGNPGSGNIQVRWSFL